MLLIDNQPPLEPNALRRLARKLTVHGSLAYRRLRSPAENGGTLIEPPLTSAAQLVAKNLERRLGTRYDVHGRPLAELARLAREELLREARRYTESYRSVGALPAADAPFFLGGHQPQIFHPGVWFKNFVLGELARQQSGVAVNLLIDSDTIKGATLPVPGGSLNDPSIEMLPFDAPSMEIPYEERRILDPQIFSAFGERAARRVAPLVPDPLAPEYWPLVVARAREGRNLGHCIAQARHQLEGQWGLSTLEIPQSRICCFESFCWFTAHLLAELPRLREVYNASVAEYRRTNHIRSTAHPVPNLAVEGNWLEAPFWIWQTTDPRRRRLFVRRRADELLLSDRAGLELSLPLSADSSAAPAVEQLQGLERRGIKLRTRALVTTMFARLLLGDLFLHGIGGAKYDQLTDSLIAEFFDLIPPDFMVVSATLRLAEPQAIDASAELRQVEHTLRDLEFNPDRHLSRENGRPLTNDAPAALIADKRNLIDTAPQSTTARQRCQEIRRLNAELQPWVDNQRQQLMTQREQLAAAARAQRILASREYAFCLHSKKKLSEMLLAFGEERT